MALVALLAFFQVVQASRRRWIAFLCSSVCAGVFIGEVAFEVRREVWSSEFLGKLNIQVHNVPFTAG